MTDWDLRNSTLTSKAIFYPSPQCKWKTLPIWPTLKLKFCFLGFFFYFFCNKSKFSRQILPQPKTMSECQTKAGNKECFEKLEKLSLSLLSLLSLLSQLSISHSITLNMLNKFCFHLYAENSLFIVENCNAFFWPPRHPILLV